jgi:hypothetical protein
MRSPERFSLRKGVTIDSQQAKPEGTSVGTLTCFHEQLDHGLARRLRRARERTAWLATATLGGARGVASAARAAQRARSSRARGVVNGSHDEA